MNIKKRKTPSGVSRWPPPVSDNLVQCLFSAEELRRRLHKKEKVDSKIYELLTELQTNESEIYLVKTQSSYRESIRERLMQKRLNLLVQLEYQLLQHPLSFRPGNERDNKVMTELFSDVSAQRRKYQKALFWLSENYLKDLFPFQVTEGKMLESGVMEAWNFLKLLYPFLIRRLTDQNPGEILLLSGIPPRLVPYDPVSFFPQMKEGDVLVRHSDSPYTGTFMTNYLAMLWQMLQQANSLSEAELDPLLIRLTSQGVLNFIESPFLDPGIGYPDSDSEAEEQPEKEEEEEDHIKWKIKWRRPSELSLGEKEDLEMEKSLSDQRGLLMEVPAFARIEHPKLVAQDILLGDVFTLGHNEEFMFARLSELPKLKERLNLLNAASDFVNMIGERVRSVDWMVMDSRHLAKNILEEKAKKLIKQEGEKTSRELGRDTRPLFGFESFELWNRQEEQDKRGNAEFLLESGEAFGRRTREEKLGSFAGRYAVHEWPHLNAFREVMNVETRTDESWGLVGRTLPAGKRHFIRVIDTNTIAQGTAFWQALGETVMLSILLGNWNFKPIDLSGIDGLELLTRNGVRPFMDPETEEVMLCMGTPRLSAQGYQRFVKKLLFKGRPDLPEQSLPGPQLVSAICGYLHKFIRKTAEDLKFPHKPQKYYEFYHGFSLCEDFIGYKAMINGMLKVLLKVAMLKDECLAVARRLDEKYGEERLIFERLIDAVFKIVDKFYWDSLAKRIFRRNWELKGLKVSAPWEKSSVLINNSDFIRSFDYRDHILSQRVILKGKPYRLLLGSFSAESADMVKAQLENEPDLAGIFIGQIFGTTNLEKTEKVGKIIRDKNLPVYLLPFGEAYSGGYSLFIAGSPAIAFYLKDFGFAETQMLGAHAWKSRSSGVRADQLPLDSPQHLPHIAYYEYLGLSPEKAREAYWLTVQAPHDSLHYFTHEDEKRLGLFKTQMLEPNKPIGEYLD